MISLIDSIVHDFKFSENTKHLGVLPLGHTAITNYQFLPSLYAGSSIFLAENFNSVRASIWKIIEEHEIDYLQVVPTVLFAMLLPAAWQNLHQVFQEMLKLLNYQNSSSSAQNLQLLSSTQLHPISHKNKSLHSSLQ